MRVHAGPCGSMRVNAGQCGSMRVNAGRSGSKRVKAGQVKAGQSLGRVTGSADLRILYLLGNKDVEVWPQLKFVLPRPYWNIKFVFPR